MKEKAKKFEEEEEEEKERKTCCLEGVQVSHPRRSRGVTKWRKHFVVNSTPEGSSGFLFMASIYSFLLFFFFLPFFSSLLLLLFLHFFVPFFSCLIFFFYILFSYYSFLSIIIFSSFFSPSFSSLISPSSVPSLPPFPSFFVFVFTLSWF